MDIPLEISIRAPLAGSDNFVPWTCGPIAGFQSALPLRGATAFVVPVLTALLISIRAPLAGSDWRESVYEAYVRQFQSALPLRGATRHERRPGQQGGISIRAPLAGSDALVGVGGVPHQISIRAPLAGSDRPRRRRSRSPSYFNPRSPCGERRRRTARSRSRSYFNPRSPCGERLSTVSCTGAWFQFQSALPLRGATAMCAPRISMQIISIRAPLAGSDKAKLGANYDAVQFQSALPLRGATLMCARACLNTLLFQSALPLRGATLPLARSTRMKRFQSALPLRGATATFCSITLLSAKYCIFKDRRRKFSRQIPQYGSRKHRNAVRTSFIEHDRPWFAIS